MTNNHILDELKKELNKKTEFSLLAEYAELKEKGLRSKSLGKLNEFIDLAKNFDDKTKYKLVSLICQKRWEYASNDFPIDSFPLNNQIIIPTLNKWIKDEPKNPEPLKWKGLFYCNGDLFDALEKYLILCPDDEFIRIKLINRYIGILDDAVHHLDEGSYLGEPDDDIKLCEKIKESIKEIKNKKDQTSLTEEIEEYQQMIQDWLDFNKNCKPNSFPEWCKSIGRTYSWLKKYYYKS